ncbi:zincin, partial [Aureobasidium melanogenum]
MHTYLLISAALAVTATASPVLKNREVTTITISGTTATSYPQPAVDIQGFPIHSSCNGTERRQLEKALGDTIKIAQQAAQHIYTHGNESALYTKYFGQAPTAEVIGWYEKLVHGDHDGWGGHWRGENATDETVICPLSYSTRQPLEALCANGYTVANGKLATYFAADLMHRLYHTTKIGEGAAEHYADTYTECLELAKENPAEAVRNTHTLQYFALDVYAMEIALPGEGCTGTPAEGSDDSHAAAPASSASSSVASAATTAAVSATASQSVSKTTSAGTECHTHAGGEIHCADIAPAETASKTNSAGTECHTHADGVVHCA